MGKDRLPTSEARAKLPATVNSFSKLTRPAESLADRAVHVGRYNRGGAVIVPEVDFQAALDREDELENIGIAMLLAERQAGGTLDGGTPIEDLAVELGLAELLE